MENELNFQHDEVSQNLEKQCLDQPEVTRGRFHEHSYSQQSSNIFEEERQQHQEDPEELRTERLRLGDDRPQEKPSKQRNLARKWPQENEVTRQDLEQEKRGGLKAEENSKNKETTTKSPMTDSHTSSHEVYVNPAAASSAESSAVDEQDPARDLTYISALSVRALYFVIDLSTNPVSL